MPNFIGENKVNSELSSGKSNWDLVTTGLSPTLISALLRRPFVYDLPFGSQEHIGWKQTCFEQNVSSFLNV